MMETFSPRWEDLDDREYRCPQCLHWWVSHGVPTEDSYGCSVIESSADDRWQMSQRALDLQRQGVPPDVAGPQAYRELRYCGCAFADGNPVTLSQVGIWRDSTCWPLAPWERADCEHARRDAQQCLDCGVVICEL